MNYEDNFEDFLTSQFADLQIRLLCEHKRRLNLIIDLQDAACGRSFFNDADDAKPPRQKSLNTSQLQEQDVASRWRESVGFMPQPENDFDIGRPRQAGEFTASVWKAFAAVVIAIVGFGFLVCYDHNLLRGPFVLDDLPRIVDNPEIHRIGMALVTPRVGAKHGTDELRYNDPSRPLVSLSFQLNFACFGLQPMYFRMVNYAIHWFNAILVYLLGRQWAKAPQAKGRLRVSFGPLLAALLFVTSPLNHGTATYVYARSDLMSSAGTLVFTFLGVRRIAQRIRDKSRPRIGVDGLSLLISPSMLLAFGIALSSKQVALSAPLALGFGHLTLSLLVLEPGNSRLRVWIASIVAFFPWLCILLAYMFARLVLLGHVGDAEMRMHASQANYKCYLAAQPYAAMRYAATLFVPWELALDHHIPADSWCGNDIEKACCFIVIVITVFSGYLLYRVPGRPQLALLLFGVGWFGIHLLPTSLPLTTDVYAERRAYLASVGLYLVVALFCGNLAHANRHYLSRLVGIGVVLTLLISFVAISRNRNASFYDEVSLWREVVRVYPDSLRGRNNLGTSLLERLYRDEDCHACASEAHSLFEGLLRENPSNVYAMMNLAELEHSLGSANNSLQWFRRVLHVDPHHAYAHFKLGKGLHRSRQWQSALEHYLAAKAIDDRIEGLHNDLAVVYAEIGNCEEARKIWSEGLSIYPDDRVLLMNKEDFENCEASIVGGQQMQDNDAIDGHVEDSKSTSSQHADASSEDSAVSNLGVENVTPGSNSDLVGRDLVLAILNQNGHSLLKPKSTSTEQVIRSKNRPIIELFIAVISCNLCDHNTILQTWWPEQTKQHQSKIFVGRHDILKHIRPEIVQLDVPDDYESVPMKLIKAMQWALANFEPRFVLKVHADTFVRPGSVASRISKMPDDSFVYQGLLSRNMPRQKDPNHRSHIPDEVYADDVLPDYIHAGMLLSFNSARHLAAQISLVFPDDVGQALAFKTIGVFPSADRNFWGGYPHEDCFGDGPDVMMDLSAHEIELAHGTSDLCAAAKAFIALRSGAFLHEKMFPCGPCKSCSAARVIDIGSSPSSSLHDTVQIIFQQYQKAAVLLPQYASAHLRMAELLVFAPHLGNVTESVSFLLGTESERLAAAERHWVAAGLLLRKGADVEANKTLARIQPLDSDCTEAEAVFLLAMVMQSSQDARADQLENLYNRAIELEPSIAGPWNNLALVLHSSGRLAEARELYEIALGNFPDDEGLQRNLYLFPESQVNRSVAATRL